MRMTLTTTMTVFWMPLKAISYDLSQPSLDGSLSVTAQDTYPTGLAFSNDGLTFLVTANTGNTVEQYSLTTAFDVTFRCDPCHQLFSRCSGKRTAQSAFSVAMA